MFEFESRRVYQQAEIAYLEMIFFLQNKKCRDYSIIDQLKRAALSIVLNIAEGYGRYSKKEKKYFYTIARGSAHECVAIIRLMQFQQYISELEYKSAYVKLEEISKMLSGIMNKLLEPTN